MRVLSRLTSAVLLPFAFVGLILVVALAGLPQSIRDEASWRKPLGGAVFSGVLALGIVAGLFPSTCSGKSHFRTLGQKEPVQKSAESSHGTPVFRGHHPDCGSFSTHVVQTKGAFFCAGCMGLVFGAAVSLLGVAGYFFLNASLGPHPLLFLWVGCAGVAGGLLQYHLFSWGGSSVHTLLNVFFVLGVFMLLAGVDALTQNVVVDVYVIVLGIFWLYVRILLSQSHHRKVCTACGKEQCRYYGKRGRGVGLSTSQAVEGAYDD